MAGRWWRISGWSDELEPVTVYAETEKTLTVDGWFGSTRRVNKSSENEVYYRTWAEAREAMIERSRAREEAARSRLQHAELVARAAEALPLEEPDVKKGE